MSKNNTKSINQPASSDLSMSAGSESVEVVPEVVSQMADAMTKRHVMICGGRNMGKTWARRIAMAQDAKPVNSLPENSKS